VIPCNTNGAARRSKAGMSSRGAFICGTKTAFRANGRWALLKSGCLTGKTGGRNGSPAATFPGPAGTSCAHTRAARQNATPSTASKKHSPSGISPRRGFISPPAVCMKLASTASAWRISSWLPAIPITRSGCSIRPAT